MLLHGGGQTRHSWARSGARFADAGWTTMSLDARGHGDSDWDAEADYSIDALVGDLQRVIDAVGEPPVLIGASLGGMTSLVAAGETPGLARALVLVDVAPRVEAVGTRRILDFMASAPDGFGSLDEVADAIAAYNPHRKRPSNLSGLTKNVRRGEDGRWRWHWDPAFLRVRDEPSREAGYARLKAAAERVTVPTLLVRGASSDVVSPEGAAELQQLIGHAVVREAKAGHMVAGDDNDVFATQVVQFLADQLP
ncbi:alpha/beta fold hydrolase [Aeromicrobium wangtongii]|uniref:alpha/beta fold hydrolase n=1 Tax=Aeromicrobium wangtongii TaxID=2969247 RepID=UPI0024B5B99E|nr:alpha/beta hydrolase [Aeromicrobium wangtongii]